MVFVVVFYDISDDGRRNIVAEKLRGFGFQRIQRSVYIARGGFGLAKEVFRALLRIVDKSTDSVVVMVVSRDSVEKGFFLGVSVGVGDKLSQVL